MINITFTSVKQDNIEDHSQGHPNLAEAQSLHTRKSIESNQAASKKNALRLQNVVPC